MILKIVNQPVEKQWPLLLKRPVVDMRRLYPRVERILNDVRRAGDSALRKYTLQYDKASINKLNVSASEIVAAHSKVDGELKKAITLAAANIRKFHAAQKQKTLVVPVAPGICCWQRSVAIEKVGLYIPGGTAPLFSTVLMLAIPAQIAGCREIILCTPPQSDGTVHPAILYCAAITGVTSVFCVGGVQAIGAMAYGTQSIPRVNKIFGPGNQYVTAAKQLVSRSDVAIDMPAGPSEVAVMADRSAVPAFIAADLLSQAEHGGDSQVLLVTDRLSIAQRVDAEVQKQLQSLPRKKFALQALRNSKVIVLKDTDQMIRLINMYAPEHLIISMRNSRQVANSIVNAGSVFVGNYTPESLGDYLSGTNHTLPTYGWAVAYNGVNLDSFVRKITIQESSAEALAKLGGAVEIMALAENLDAHANAVTVRMAQWRRNNKTQKTKKEKQ